MRSSVALYAKWATCHKIKISIPGYGAASVELQVDFNSYTLFSLIEKYNHIVNWNLLVQTSDSNFSIGFMLDLRYYSFSLTTGLSYLVKGGKMKRKWGTILRNSSILIPGRTTKMKICIRTLQLDFTLFRHTYLLFEFMTKIYLLLLSFKTPSATKHYSTIIIIIPLPQQTKFNSSSLQLTSEFT